MKMHLIKALTLTTGALLAAAGAARADNLDQRLLDEAPRIMKYLQEHQYQNVGVLKFRVELGKKQASFNVGPMNSNLARRLQNALVLLEDPAKPVGLLEDPNRVAATKNLPSYMTPAGREALFRTTFPLAWGSATVQPDAFVTGLVKVDPNMRKGHVFIQAFDVKGPKMNDVCQFDFDTDRAVLTDLGQSFVVARRGVGNRISEDDQDKQAADDAAARDDKKKGTPLETGESPVKLEIRYDGAPQGMTPDPTSAGELAVAEPQERQMVSFIMRNTSNERMAVVLKVNGKNTLYEEDEEPVQCTKWVLDPGEELEVKGFSIKEDKLEIPFKVLSTAESEAMTYTENLGMIQMSVFRAGGGDELKVSLRGLSSRQASKAARPRSLKELQQRTLTATGMRNTRGVLEKDPEAAGKQTNYRTVEFPNPTQVMDLRIRYYRPRGT